MKNATSLNHDLNFGYDNIKYEDGVAFFNDAASKGLVRSCYADTNSYQSYLEMCQIPHGKAQPCGKDTVGKIYRALKKFFIVLRGLKKYLDKYVNQTLNAIQNLQSEIQATIQEIVGVLKTLVHRAREWVLKKIKKGIEDLIDKATTPQTTEPKKALLSRIIDEIFCKFDDIIAGLFNLVGDFLYSLIGKVINVPFCAVESFINALLSKLLNDIDRALKPFFDQINKALAPVSKIMGSVFQVIDYILGFEGFLCEKPECNDELKEFEAGPWGRPQNTKTDNWSNFSFSSGISKSVNGWMNDFFGAGKGGGYVSPGGCYAGDFNCGVNVEIFGGGGSGAAGAAVVNKIGQIVGVNLFNGGSGYTSPPFVSFVDPGGCGNNASGHANIENGEIIDIPIDNPGIGYTDTYPLSPVIRDFIANPSSVELGKSILFTWDTENATNVSLSSKDYTLTGYSKLSLDGSQIVGINSSDISFPAGKTSTFITYTLTANKTVVGWGEQNVYKDVKVEVYLPGSTPSSLTPSTTSTSSPSIYSFDATPQLAKVGNVVKFNWQTLDTTSVGLGLSIGPGIVTSLYDNLVPNGAASIVLPNDLTFPSDGSNIKNTYVLTAINTKAPVGKNTDVKYTSIEIVSPKTSLPDWKPLDPIISTSTSAGVIDFTGTLPGGTGGTGGEFSSGSLEDLGSKGIYTPPSGGGTGTLDGGSVTPDGEKTGGGGDDPIDTIDKFLPIGGTSFGGAGIDPTGDSTTSVTKPSSTDTTIPSGGSVSETIPVGGTTPIIDAEIGGAGAGTGAGTGTDTGTGTGAGSEVISEIKTIEIISTGTGYSPNDKVQIIGGNNGAELEIETTPSGQIINIKVISGGYGFVTIPQIRINTVDGLGAKFRPVLRFIPASRFTQRELDRIGTDKLLRVVDCVLK